MKLSSHDMVFLQGDEFSNGLHVRYEYEMSDYKYRSRISVLRDLCTGKKIVHLGCVDHNADMINRKLGKNKWLHKHLCDVSARCLGVDLSEQGIAYIKDELGYNDVMALDMASQPCDEIENTFWDYLLIPEVLEHIGNPAQFLVAIQNMYPDRFGQFIITVPNAFSLDIMNKARNGIEVINTDHRFWFTPYTLSKLVQDAGLVPESMIMCKGGVVNKRSWLRNYRFSRNPLLRGNIVMLCKPS